MVWNLAKIELIIKIQVIYRPGTDFSALFYLGGERFQYIGLFNIVSFFLEVNFQAMASWDNLCYVDVLANLEPALEVTKVRYAFSFYFYEGKREENLWLANWKTSISQNTPQFHSSKTHTHTNSKHQFICDFFIWKMVSKLDHFKI